MNVRYGAEIYILACKWNSCLDSGVSRHDFLRYECGCSLLRPVKVSYDINVSSGLILNATQKRAKELETRGKEECKKRFSLGAKKKRPLKRVSLWFLEKKNMRGSSVPKQRCKQ